MKIAIPYNSGEVFGHFGKAEQFKIYTVIDDEVLTEEVVNTDGSGHSALADFLKGHGINLVICGGIGTGAVMALREAGIQLMGGASGQADDRVQDFLGGQLHFEQSGASCCGHHGCGHGGNDENGEEETDGNISACGESCCH